MTRTLLLAVAVVFGSLYPAAAQTAVFIGTNSTCQGDWRACGFGTVGVNLYPDGGDTPSLIPWAKGVGTQAAWPKVSRDPRLPRRGSFANYNASISWAEGTIATSAPWPAGADHFGAGYYHRIADGVPMRIGFNDSPAGVIRFYLVDYDRQQRQIRIDVYAQGARTLAPDPEAEYANGPLLDSRTFDHFEEGIYPGWDVTGPVIFQFTALPDDTNGLAVESGIFLDPPGSTVPIPVTCAVCVPSVTDVDGAVWSLGAPAAGGLAVLMNGLPYALGGSGLGYFYAPPQLFLFNNIGNYYLKVPNGQFQKMDYDPTGIVVPPPAPPPQPPVPPDTYPAHVGLTFAADHDGVDVDLFPTIAGYHCYLDNVRVVPEPSRVGLEVFCDLQVAALTPGAHTVAISAYNDKGEARSVPYPFSIAIMTTGTPNQPTHGRLVITVPRP